MIGQIDFLNQWDHCVESESRSEVMLWSGFSLAQYHLTFFGQWNTKSLWFIQSENYWWVTSFTLTASSYVSWSPEIRFFFTRASWLGQLSRKLLKVAMRLLSLSCMQIYAKHWILRSRWLLKSWWTVWKIEKGCWSWCLRSSEGQGGGRQILFRCQVSSREIFF